MKKWIWIIFIVLLVLITVEILEVHYPNTFGWQSIKGHQAFIGFIGSIALLFLAKGLGQFWLYRKENYYDDQSSS